MLPRGSVVPHAPALTLCFDDSLSALLASTTHCQSFSLLIHSFHSLYGHSHCLSPTDPLMIGSNKSCNTPQHVSLHTPPCFYSQMAAVLLSYYSLTLCSMAFSRFSDKVSVKVTLQVHLVVYRAVSPFTTALTKSTGSVNTSPLFLVPLLALDINGRNDRNDTVSTTDNDTSTWSSTSTTSCSYLHSYHSYLDDTSGSFSLYTLPFLMACSFFIRFVSTVCLAGEYCSELTHHDTSL